ncbi:MAG: class I tRNA ligase family protein [Bacteroidales bacterium]|nr:class I tRNA ligase family protein [Bacteroidales bacterium]
MTNLIALRTKCPHCKKSFMDPYDQINGKPSIKVDIEANEKKGRLRLCSYYGCFDHKSSIELPKDEPIKFFCPHCNKALTSSNKCEECGAPMIPFALEKGGKVYICSKVGCKKHFISFQDVSDALRKMYNEFGYF